MNEWISISIKPKKNNMWYLVYIPGTSQVYAVSYFVDDFVGTHYTELPEPPKQKP